MSNFTSAVLMTTIFPQSTKKFPLQVGTAKTACVDLCGALNVWVSGLLVDRTRTNPKPGWRASLLVPRVGLSSACWTSVPSFHDVFVLLRSNLCHFLLAFIFLFLHLLFKLCVKGFFNLSNCFEKKINI